MVRDNYNDESVLALWDNVEDEDEFDVMQKGEY